MTNLKKTINDYFKNRKEVIAVYLFGSHASGHERPFSDVDIGVILEHPDMDRSAALQGEYTLGLGRTTRKDVHTVILNTASEVLLKQVFAKGFCLLVNHDHAFKHFKMIRYSMIADFGYYLNMAQAGFQRKMMESQPNG